MMQTTIKSPVRCQGIDIFGRSHTAITLYPAPANSGIIFERGDLPGSPRVHCNSENVLVESRWTVLEQNGIRVEHTEHLLATLAGLAIDNIIVRMDGPSLPVVDGYSCADFVAAIQRAGIEKLPVKRRYLTVHHPCLVQDEFYYDNKRYDKFLLALPANQLELTYVLDYPDNSVAAQQACHGITPQMFISELAGARSYITQGEYQRVARLIGKGMQSVLVFSPGKRGDLRWPNEPARHKLVDLLGDLYTIGLPLKGRFIGVRSGHQLNIKMVKKLAKVCEG